MQPSRVGPVCTHGQSAPNSLQGQASNVSGYEDDRIQRWRQQRERGAHGPREVLQGQVQRDTEDSWPEDDGADLRLKGLAAPWADTEISNQFSSRVDVFWNKTGSIALLPIPGVAGELYSRYVSYLSREQDRV